MIKNIYIQKLIGFFLICLFAISVTPVIVLHNLAANHKDVITGVTKEQGTRVSKYGINCHCIDFVAESPFINNFFKYDLSIPGNVSLFIPHHNELFFPEHPFLNPQRGPPTII